MIHEMMGSPPVPEDALGGPAYTFDPTRPNRQKVVASDLDPGRTYTVALEGQAVERQSVLLAVRFTALLSAMDRLDTAGFALNRKGAEPTAARASTSPAPTTSAVPPLVTAAAVASSADFTDAGDKLGDRWRKSAATAAAWGAAAEVPKKRQGPHGGGKKVFTPPSVAATSGLLITSGEGSGGAGVVPDTGPK